ncbi:MAG: hypothetical protein CMM93_08655, partial [Rickettsiales bacterium]|nr:hypothetical protein [Rickettsiales bacterium]
KLSGFPSNPGVAQFFWHTGDGVGYTYNGVEWVPDNETASSLKTKYESNSNTNAFTDSEKTKLSGIEEGATGDQTGSEIKSLYEAETNTNAFTDSFKAKLQSIDATHYLEPVQDVTALAALVEADLTDKARTYVEDETSDYFYDATAVSGDVAPGDQTGGTGFWKKVSTGGDSAAQVKTKYESNPDTNAFTDAEKTKLSSSPVKVTGTITGDGSATSFAITHSLNTKDLLVSMREDSSDNNIFPDVNFNTVNQLTISFATAPATAKIYEVTIIG